MVVFVVVASGIAKVVGTMIPTRKLSSPTPLFFPFSSWLYLKAFSPRLPSAHHHFFFLLLIFRYARLRMAREYHCGRPYEHKGIHFHSPFLSYHFSPPSAFCCSLSQSLSLSLSIFLYLAYFISPEGTCGADCSKHWPWCWRFDAGGK